MVPQRMRDRWLFFRQGSLFGATLTRGATTACCTNVSIDIASIRKTDACFRKSLATFEFQYLDKT